MNTRELNEDPARTKKSNVYVIDNVLHDLEKYNHTQNPNILPNEHTSKMSTSQDVEMTEAHHETPRRQKKQRQRVSPGNTPSSSKKQRPSKSVSPTASSAKSKFPRTTRSKSRPTTPTKDATPSYVKLNPGIKDEVIKGMSTDNLLKEITKIARKRSITLSTDAFIKAGKALLIKRAIAFKKLSDPLPVQKFVIYHSTPDEDITSLSIRECRPLYIASLKERSIPLDLTELDQYKDIDYHARLLNYRDFLRAKHKELEDMMFAKLLKDNTNLQAQLSESKPKLPPAPVKIKVEKIDSSKSSTTQNTENMSSTPASGSSLDGLITGQSLEADVKRDENVVTQNTQDEQMTGDDKCGNMLSKTDQHDKHIPPPDDGTALRGSNDGAHIEKESAESKNMKSTQPHPSNEQQNAPHDVKPPSNSNANLALGYANTIGTSNDPTRSQFPRFDATHVSRVTSDSTPLKNGNAERDLKTIRYSTISIRTRWFGDYYTRGMDECARELIQKLREIDASMRIIPTTNEAEDILVHEKDYVDKDREKWLRNTFSLHNPTFNALNFTVQVKTHKSYKWMNEVITKYFVSGGNQVNVDTIAADRLVTIGFFANIHKGFHNKNRLKTYCTRYLKEQHNIEAQLNIFPRNYHAGGNADDKGYLISVEVSPQVAQTVNNALMRCPFHGYTDVKYMPFTKYDDKYMEQMRGVITYHREFKKKIETLRIPKFNHLHSKVDIITSGFETIRDIIMSFNTPERNFVYDVDTGNGWSTAIIYNIDAEQHMDEFLRTLVPTLQQHLTAESFSQVYQYDKPLLDLLTSTRRVSAYERDHVKNVFSQYKISTPAKTPLQHTKVVNVWKSRSKSINAKIVTPPPVTVSEPSTSGPSSPVASRPKPPHLIEKDLPVDAVNKNLSTDTTNTNQSNVTESVPSKKIEHPLLETIDMAGVQAMINAETAKLRAEMRSEKDVIMGEISNVKSALTLELQNATKPFAETLRAVQQSNQQILGMMAGTFAFHQLPMHNQIVPFSVPSSPAGVVQNPFPAIRLPQVKVEPDGEC